MEAAIAAEAMGSRPSGRGSDAVQPAQVETTYPYGEGEAYPLPLTVRFSTLDNPRVRRRQDDGDCVGS